ncbi:MAG: hypothetical protein WKG00_31760 [Polyangiaceae bacterium]
MAESRSTPRVALVTSEAFPELFSDDQLLIPALAELGVRAEPAVWSRGDVDWTAFDALVIRSPWDYFERPVEFRRWLDARIASGITLCNAGETILWNFDKRYLAGMAEAGVATVPTLFVGQGASDDIAALVRARGWDDIVIKPTVAGGAYRTHRLRVADYARYAEDVATTLKDRGVLVQPFLPEIVAEGELSLLFFDGVFSHAACKRAKAGDYRVQFTFGGTFDRVEMAPALIEQARACIAHAPGSPAYARVDGVLQDGRFILMELEVFEPFLFLALEPEAPRRLALAIQKRLAPRR